MMKKEATKTTATVLRNAQQEQNYKFLLSAGEKPSFLIGNSLLIKLLLFPLSILRAIFRSFNRSTMSAAEFDKRVAARVAEAKQRVFGVLGVDQSQVREAKPIIADGIHYSDDTFYTRDKKTGVSRASRYEVSIYLFSAKEIYVYTYQFSMTDDWKREITNEYFYQDIVSVEVSNETYLVSIGERSVLVSDLVVPVNINEFTLLTTSGRAVKSAFIGDSTLQSINAMKQLIREKKA